MDQISALQEKVEKLQLKKDELERSIYPDRYQVADISGIDTAALELPMRHSDSSDASEVGSVGGSEGEEEALLDLVPSKASLVAGTTEASAGDASVAESGAKADN